MEKSVKICGNACPVVVQSRTHSAIAVRRCKQAVDFIKQRDAGIFELRRVTAAFDAFSTYATLRKSAEAAE